MLHTHVQSLSYNTVPVCVTTLHPGTDSFYYDYFTHINEVFCWNFVLMNALWANKHVVTTAVVGFRCYIVDY